MKSSTNVSHSCLIPGFTSCFNFLLFATTFFYTLSAFVGSFLKRWSMFIHGFYHDYNNHNHRSHYEPHSKTNKTKRFSTSGPNVAAVWKRGIIFVILITIFNNSSQSHFNKILTSLHPANRWNDVYVLHVFHRLAMKQFYWWVFPERHPHADTITNQMFDFGLRIFIHFNYALQKENRQRK